MIKNQRGSIVIILEVVLVLLAIAGAFYYYFYFQKKLPITFPSVGSIVLNSPKYSGSYKTAKVGDAVDVYYQGPILKVINGENNTYRVTMKASDENGQDQVIEILVPKTPPVKYPDKVGKDFKVMVDKGIRLVNIRVRLNVQNQPTEWELI